MLMALIKGHLQGGDLKPRSLAISHLEEWRTHFSVRMFVL